MPRKVKTRHIYTWNLILSSFSRFSFFLSPVPNCPPFKRHINLSIDTSENLFLGRLLGKQKLCHQQQILCDVIIKPREVTAAEESELIICICKFREQQSVGFSHLVWKLTHSPNLWKESAIRTSIGLQNMFVFYNNDLSFWEKLPRQTASRLNQSSGRRRSEKAQLWPGTNRRKTSSEAN